MLSIRLISLIVAIPNFSYCITTINFNRITSIIMIYSALLSYNSIYYDSLASGINIYSGLFNITIIVQFLEIFILIIGAIILFNWGPKINNIVINLNINTNYNNNNNITINPTKNNFYLRILFTIIGSCILISSYDLISIYLSIELQSFAIYIITTLYNNSKSSTNAGLKYFLLGGLSSCIILFGSAIIYNYTGITQFQNFYILIQYINNNDIENGIIFGRLLIIIGFIFKIAAAPIHNWRPDVYDRTPTIITIWLTTIPKISLLIFILEIQSIFNYIEIQDNIMINFLIIISFFSIIIGSIIGLNQYRIKRLFAYSTINHIGFILLRLSINTEKSLEAFLFYIIQYSLININIYSIILAFGYYIYKSNSNIKNKYNIKSKNFLEIEFISEFKGKFLSNPILSISFCICLFSLAGVPPIIGFFAKIRVLNVTIYNNYYFISIIAIFVSVISAFYYLKIVRIIYFDNDNDNDNNDNNDNDNDNDNNINNKYNINTIEVNSYNNYNTITNIHSILISILTIIIIIFIFQPWILLNSCNIICLSLYNY